ncbi:HCLS1 protein, partial [Rhynochetos jubatus]|nr:HCLS1 protein [Rhynochetos jubatus]
MWKAVVGHDVSVKVEAQGDDWDTDPDFVVSVWCASPSWWESYPVPQPSAWAVTSIHQLRNKVSEEHEVIKKKELETGPKASYGYGGKFGTERDRMDKCAVGHEYVADVGKHSSQTDAAQGFGGKYGVQRDRADKSALGFEYKGEVEKHSSQKGKSLGTGFGGRYGVERDKVDKAAVGFDYRSQEEKHNSQKDYAKGFGGRFGIQEDRVDESAAGFDGMAAPTSSYERARPLEPVASGTSSLRSRFEDMAKAAEASRQQAEERARRPARDSHVAQHKVSPGSGSLCRVPHGLRSSVLRAVQLHILPCDLISQHCFPAAARDCPGTSQLSRGFPLQHTEQGAKREDEEVPPTLPPRPADLGEELCEDPSQDQPIYSESLDVGGDYEELPEPSHYGNGAVGGADYEELPAPLGKPDATYDHGGDGGEDYEELLPEEPSQSQPHQGDPGTCAVALYDYQGDGDDEISFDPEDTITHIEMVDEGWWRGRCRGRVGLFPANYVRLLH